MKSQKTGENPKPEIKEKKFALAITQRVNSSTGQVDVNIASKNDGINDSDVFLLVECWLEKVKDNLKSKIKDSIKIGMDPDKGYEK